MYASIISMAGEEENKVFKVVEGPGKVDVTDDDPKMLKRFTDETGAELDINRDENGRLIAKVRLVAVKPKKQA